MHLVLFEDAHWRSLIPITLSRPAFSLVSGIEPIWTSLVRQYPPTRVTLWVRPSMEPPAHFAADAMPGDDQHAAG
jgi:hypothetical protein